MAKKEWNFDLIFSGTPEEIECKSSHFMTGLKQRIKESEAKLADALLYNRSDVAVEHAQIHEYVEVGKAFLDDPRCKEMERVANEREEREKREKLRSLFDEAINRVIDKK